MSDTSEAEEELLRRLSAVLDGACDDDVLGATVGILVSACVNHPHPEKRVVQAIGAIVSVFEDARKAMAQPPRSQDPSLS